MERLKILDLIGHLSPKEKESVAFFLNSGFISVKPELKNLFENLMVQNGKYDKTVLWKAVFPTSKPDENKYRKLCHELLQTVELALAMQHLLLDEDKMQQQLLGYYLENELPVFFEQKIGKTRALNNSHHKIGSNRYLHQYQLEHQYFLYMQKQENIQSSLNISISSQSLDRFYCTQKLKYICNSINYKAILGKTEFIEFDTEVFSMIEKSALKDDALIAIYYSIYQLQTNTENESIYPVVRQLLEQHAPDLEKPDLSDILQYLINFCIKKINQSREAYLDELFIIYTIYLQNVREKVFSPIRFKNIFLLALKMKKFEWAELFIDGYGGKLPLKVRETTIAYNKARLYYDTRQFDRVLDTLLHLQHDEVQFNLISKVLIVKTFYEKNEIQFLENYIQSFKAYILRNKEMNQQNKKIHLNFLKMMKKLIRLEYASKDAIAQFKETIVSTENLPDKIWFLEKIELL